MSSEQLCLKWNNFENNIASFLDILRNDNALVDVTITCENNNNNKSTNFKAHKLILSACSPYFKSIFQETPCAHPVVILKNVMSSEMEAILRYMYTGETHIAEHNLQSFLNTANLLQVIGLATTDDRRPSRGTDSESEEVRHRWRVAKNQISSFDSVEDDQKDRWRHSRQHSSFETSEDEGTSRKRSPEPIEEALAEGAKRGAEEKSWKVRCKGLPPPKKRSLSGGNLSEGEEETPLPTSENKPQTEGPCPILSKQLLLPKKRKVSSVLDQNKNVEFVADHSDSSEGEVPAKSEGGEEQEEGRSVLEPEVGLSVKDEPSDSDDSLPNGDILLQRLKGAGTAVAETKSEDSRILRVPNPDVSIFTQRLVTASKEGEVERIEHLTLAPNVDVFLRNSNNTENLLAKLSKINVFKAKRKQLRPEPCTSKAEDGKLHLTHLPCPHCSQLYNNLSALKYHVRLMHSDLENKLFCYLCPMNFIERDFFKMHLWEVHHARF